MLLAVFLRFLLKNGVMARFENREKKNPVQNEDLVM
jgi:hypothetical protein